MNRYIVHVCVHAHVRLPVLGRRASSLLLDRKQPSCPSKDEFPSLGLTPYFFACRHIHFPLFQGRYRKCILPKRTWCQLVARRKNTEAGKYTSASGIEALLFPQIQIFTETGFVGIQQQFRSVSYSHP